MNESENFKRWTKKHAKRSPIFAVLSSVSMLDGSDVSYNPDKTMASNIIIGLGEMDDGYVHGSRLSEIICNGIKAKTWAFGPRYKMSVIDGWVEGYIAGGVCFIDPEHVLYSNWDQPSENERACKYCGYEQIRKTEMIPTYSWVPRKRTPA